MKGVRVMNFLRLSLVLSFPFLYGHPLAGQTPDEAVVKLKARVKALEAENSELKQSLAKQSLGSLGVPFAKIVTIDGEFVLDAPIKSIYRFRVTAVNGKKLPEAVHVYTESSKWACSTPSGGKTPTKMKGFQCITPVGDPYGRTGMGFGLVETFMILEILEEKEIPR